MSKVCTKGRSGQSLTEYVLLLFLAILIFTTVVKVLGPVLSRLVKSQERSIERRLGEGLYQYRFPSR
ncbi:MAG: hypothetical protein ACK5QT_00580 [Oligoflexia bacterium]